MAIVTDDIAIHSVFTPRAGKRCFKWSWRCSTN